MKHVGFVSVLLCAVMAGVWLGCSPGPQAAEESSGWRPMTPEQYAASLPKDVYPDSRGRLPLVRREDLDEEGKKAYDRLASPNDTSLAGFAGPGGIGLHASRNRSESGVDRRLQELARLVVSREMDQAFEWTVHEPEALRQRLEPAIIDIVRYRKPLTGVPEKEASIIQLGRELFEKHKVSSETFARAYKQLGARSLVDLCDFMGSYTNTAIKLHTVNAHLPRDRQSLLPPLGTQLPSNWSPMTPEAYAASLPRDVHPDSRGRLPLPKREDLDEEGKKSYDSHMSPNDTSLAGIAGPGGIGLHGSRGENLREATRVSRRLQELARLVVAREWDQAFEWTVHEPVALKEGLEPAIIDVVRHRKPLTGVPEKEASIIQLGREIFGQHRVSSETFSRIYKQLGARDLVDLCNLMGSYATTAIKLHTVDAHLPYDREPLLPVS
ncbi:MAG: hypothetical protein HY313_00765 [Acidobacteria bacterium]|nr:hypothetical protein [Acidobacteriota bacterium]